MLKITGTDFDLSPILGSIQVVWISPFQVPLRLGNGTNQFLKIGDFHKQRLKSQQNIRSIVTTVDSIFKTVLKSESNGP